MLDPVGSKAFEVVKIYGDAQVAEVGVLRFRGSERHIIEVVDGLAPPIERERKWIINISTQFGCPVHCPFCDAAFDYAGNLDTEELLMQVTWALERHPGMAKICRKLKVHFARMGEPAYNPNVLEAMDRLPDVVRGEGLWCCVATVAPSGRDDWFERLYEVKEKHFRGRFQLQFSVQSTSEEVRDRLIPVKHWSLEKLEKYGSGFHQPGDRKVVLNFALARDASFDPRRVADLFDPDRFALKLTPINPTATGRDNGFETVLRSDRDKMLKDAIAQLTEHGFDVVISVGDEREDQIGSNCGQAVRVERKNGLQ